MEIIFSELDFNKQKISSLYDHLLLAFRYLNRVYNFDLFNLIHYLKNNISRKIENIKRRKV